MNNSTSNAILAEVKEENQANASDWSGNRNRPDAIRRRTQESLTPIWEFFRYDYDNKESKCLVNGCDLTLKAMGTKPLSIHLKAFHYPEFLKYMEANIVYLRRRYAHFLEAIQEIREMGRLDDLLGPLSSEHENGQLNGENEEAEWFNQEVFPESLMGKIEENLKIKSED